MLRPISFIPCATPACSHSVSIGNELISVFLFIFFPFSAFSSFRSGMLYLATTMSSQQITSTNFLFSLPKKKVKKKNIKANEMQRRKGPWPSSEERESEVMHTNVIITPPWHVYCPAGFSLPPNQCPTLTFAIHPSDPPFMSLLWSFHPLHPLLLSCPPSFAVTQVQWG